MDGFTLVALCLLGSVSVFMYQHILTVYYKTRMVPQPVTDCSHESLNNSLAQKYAENKFLFANAYGRFGNQLFIYASAYGIAKYLNRTLVFSNISLILPFVDIAAEVVGDYNCVAQQGVSVLESKGCAFDESLMTLPSGSNYCVGRRLQSYKYFEHVKEDIKKQFTIKKSFRNTAKKIVEEAIEIHHKRTNRTDRPILVGVHIRREDKVNDPYGNQVATPQYMNKATTYFREKYNNVLFLVVAIDRDWAQEHIRGDDVIHMPGRHYIIDLAVLVSCDHTLSTVGTFSWWAGYLTGGEVVYFKWPARRRSTYRTVFSSDFSDYFPPAWIGMR